MQALESNVIVIANVLGIMTVCIIVSMLVFVRPRQSSDVLVTLLYSNSLRVAGIIGILYTCHLIAEHMRRNRSTGFIYDGDDCMRPAKNVMCSIFEQPLDTVAALSTGEL